MKRLSSLIKACTLVFFVLFFASKSVTSVTAIAVSCPEFNSQSPAIGQRCPKEMGPGFTLTCGVNSRSVCTCSEDRPCLGDPSDIDARTKIVGILNLDSPSSSTQTPVNQVAGYPYCPGQCKGESSVNKKSIGTICTGIDNICYRCDSDTTSMYGGSFVKVASSLCAANSAPTQTTTSPSIGACDGCSDEGTCRDFKKGTYQVATDTFHKECLAQKGYCSGTTVCGGGSTSTAPVTGNLSCGDKCTTSADCRNPSANGAPVACVNGTCQNTLCAAGQTIPGANCSCGANTRKCGQTCSGALGLCAPGQGTCTYVNTSGPYCPWGWSQTYCAGSSNGYKRTACTTGDAPGGGYLVGPAGKTSGLTVAEITASCQVCGNGSIETGEYCDDGKLNGDATQCTCSKSCQLFSGSLLINGVSTPVSVARGSSVTLTWNTAGMAKCTASNGWTGDKSVKGTETITGVSANTQFDLLCTQASTGRPVTLSANVNITGTTPAPSIDFMINKSNDPVVTTKTVNWATQFAVFNAYFNWNTSGATTCVGYTTPSPQSVYPFPGTVPYVTTASNAGWFLFDKTQPVNLTSTTAALAVINDATAAKYGVFTLTCTGAGGKTSRTILVTTDVPATKSSCGAPVATPTPLPLVCSMLPTVKSTGNVNAWKIGDSITFGVAAASSAGIPTNSKIRYEGQVSAYRGNAQISTINLTPINATASQFMPMKVNAVNATYYYRFRYCVMSITNVETCSAWGAWTAPSGV